MDVQMSRKAKVVVLIIVLILAFPLYALSDLGMSKWTQQCWDHPDDAKTPDRLIFLAKVYSTTWRDDKMVEIVKEWIRHYGGDETEKKPEDRYISWEPYPWTEENKRPDQKGENYRLTPHPRTGEVLMMYVEELEKGHQYQMMAHVNDIILQENTPVPKIPEVINRALAAKSRNTSGNRSF